MKMIRQVQGLDSKAETFSEEKIEAHLKALVSNERFCRWWAKEARNVKGGSADRIVASFICKNKELEPLTQPEWVEMWNVLEPFISAIEDAKRSLRMLDAKWVECVMNTYVYEAPK